MGHLASPTGLHVQLPARALAGRSRASFILLDDAQASSEHAVLRWSSGAWNIRDLTSRNGTFVNGRRIGPGIEVELARGDRIGFGSDGRDWIMEDTQAPQLIAMDLVRRTIRSTEGTLLALPSDEQPVVSVYFMSGRGWVIESHEDTTNLTEGEPLVIGSSSWVVFPPDEPEQTLRVDRGLSVAESKFVFSHSANEESVRVSVIGASERADVGSHEYFYVLLLLARRRKADAHRPEPERGWIDRDELVSLLRIESSLVDVHIHRARRKLAAANVVDATSIVQVRRRERRLGTDAIELVLVS